MQAAVNYSVDQMVRYAYEYELNNLLKIPEKQVPANDDVRKQIRRFEDMGIELLLLKYFPTVDYTRRIAEELIEPMRTK